MPVHQWLLLLLTMFWPFLAIGQPPNTKSPFNFTWPAKKVADVEGELILGGLMMVHERHDDITCGPIMPQGGIQVCSLFLLFHSGSHHITPTLYYTHILLPFGSGTGDYALHNR